MALGISFSPPAENTVIYSNLKGWYILYQCLILLSLKIQMLRGELNDHISNMYGK